MVQKPEMKFDQVNSNSKKQLDESLAVSMNPNEAIEQVKCNGCGIEPIVGVKYKCSVLANFYFCVKCEETKDHPHAFLKIKANKPSMNKFDGSISKAVTKDDGNNPE